MDELEKQAIIKELAKQQAFGVKKLMSLGGSYAVVIPMTWIKFHCTEIDGDYYFKLGVEGDTLVLRAIDDEDLENVTLKRKPEVSKA